MDAAVDHVHRGQRQVQQRPHDPSVRRRDLGREEPARAVQLQVDGVSAPAACQCGSGYGSRRIAKRCGMMAAIDSLSWCCSVACNRTGHGRVCASMMGAGPVPVHHAALIATSHCASADAALRVLCGALIGPNKCFIAAAQFAYHGA